MRLRSSAEVEKLLLRFTARSSVGPDCNILDSMVNFMVSTRIVYMALDYRVRIAGGGWGV